MSSANCEPLRPHSGLTPIHPHPRAGALVRGSPAPLAPADEWWRCEQHVRPARPGRRHHRRSDGRPCGRRPRPSGPVVPGPGVHLSRPRPAGHRCRHRVAGHGSSAGRPGGRVPDQPRRVRHHTPRRRPRRSGSDPRQYRLQGRLPPSHAQPLRRQSRHHRVRAGRLAVDTGRMARRRRHRGLRRQPPGRRTGHPTAPALVVRTARQARPQPGDPARDRTGKRLFHRLHLRHHRAEQGRGQPSPDRGHHGPRSGHRLRPDPTRPRLHLSADVPRRGRRHRRTGRLLRRRHLRAVTPLLGQRLLGRDPRHRRHPLQRPRPPAAHPARPAGLAPGDPRAATPIGFGRRICERRDCAQQARPPAGGRLPVDPDRRTCVPYPVGTGTPPTSGERWIRPRGSSTGQVPSSSPSAAAGTRRHAVGSTLSTVPCGRVEQLR